MVSMRSPRTVALAMILLAATDHKALAQTPSVVVKPGDSGTIEYEISNTGTGPNERLEEVTINVVVPDALKPRVSFGAITIKEDPSQVLPVTIEPSGRRTFVIPYQIVEGASDASGDVSLDVSMLNQLTEPIPDTLDALVSFAIASPDSSTRTA